MRVMNHNWSATKQSLHPQSVTEISRHSVLSGDRIRQCGTWTTQYCSTETVLLISPFLQTIITSQMWPSEGKGGHRLLYRNLLHRPIAILDAQLKH